MKRIMAILIVAVMIFCGLNVLAEEETIEVAASEEALTEQEVAEAPAEETPAEEPAAEVPAAEEPAAEPAQEPAAEAPAAETPAAEPAPEVPAAAEPAQEPAAETPAAEPAPEAPAAAEPAKEPAAEKPAEEKPAEKPAEKVPAAEPVKEEPVAETPAEQKAEQEPAAELAQEPAEEVPAEKPAEEKPAEEPVKEEPAVEEPAVTETTEESAAEEAAASFTGTLTVRYSHDPVETGAATFFKATVQDENMAYTLQWELETETGWTAISGANAAIYAFTVNMPAGTYNYRVVLTAEDGTILTAPATLVVVEPETEELSGEAPAEEQPEAEETAEEVSAEEQVEGEEPAENIADEEQPEAEEPVAEEETDETGLTELEDYKTPLGLPQEEEVEPEKNVTIFVNRDENRVNLTSRIEGFDGYEIRYQGECDKHDGAGFQDVAGANGSTYSVEATSETLKWEWRLSVYC